MMRVGVIHILISSVRLFRSPIVSATDNQDMQHEHATLRRFGGEAVLESDGVTCTICRLFVHEMLRGKGTGTQLIKDAYWWARRRRCRYLRVCPEPENPERRDDLIRFYKRNGFHLTSDNDAMLRHL
jgi:GNAT superfamily N-acetyltransferase